MRAGGRLVTTGTSSQSRCGNSADSQGGHVLRSSSAVCRKIDGSGGYEVRDRCHSLEQVGEVPLGRSSRHGVVCDIADYVLDVVVECRVAAYE